MINHYELSKSYYDFLKYDKNIVLLENIRDLSLNRLQYLRNHFGGNDLGIHTKRGLHHRLAAYLELNQPDSNWNRRCPNSGNRTAVECVLGVDDQSQPERFDMVLLLPLRLIL